MAKRLHPEGHKTLTYIALQAMKNCLLEQQKVCSVLPNSKRRVEG
jgi:hypothetical protein